MASVGEAGAAAGLSPQFQIAAAKKALDVQKQQGAAALSLIESATAATQAAISSGPKATGNHVDVTV